MVVDHDSGRVVWAAPGRDKKTLNLLFDALGRSGCDRLREVSADGAGWIGDVVHSRCLNAKLIMDNFHVVQWATDALDEVRRRGVGPGPARPRGKVLANRLKGCRYALWKNPERLTRRQRGRLAWVAHTSAHLYRA